MTRQLQLLLALVVALVYAAPHGYHLRHHKEPVHKPRPIIKKYRPKPTKTVTYKNEKVTVRGFRNSTSKSEVEGEVVAYTEPVKQRRGKPSYSQQDTKFYTNKYSQGFASASSRGINGGSASIELEAKQRISKKSYYESKKQSEITSITTPAAPAVRTRPSYGRRMPSRRSSYTPYSAPRPYSSRMEPYTPTPPDSYDTPPTSPNSYDTPPPSYDSYATPPPPPSPSYTPTPSYTSDYSPTPSIPIRRNTPIIVIPGGFGGPGGDSNTGDGGDGARGGDGGAVRTGDTNGGDTGKISNSLFAISVAGDAQRTGNDNAEGANGGVGGSGGRGGDGSDGGFGGSGGDGVDFDI